MPSSRLKPVILAATAHRIESIRTADARVLTEELARPEHDEAELNALNAPAKINALGAIPNTWVKRTLKNRKRSEYLTRLAEQLAKERN